MSAFFLDIYRKNIASNIEISVYEKNVINQLIRHANPSLTPLEQMWSMMDRVWQEFDCDNLNPTPEKLSLFYSHPVWLLNGFFIESDPVSMSHRVSIADWIEARHKKGHIMSVLDFGGGFGTLALEIAKRNHDCKVVIFEPFPTQFALSRTAVYKNISWSTALNPDTFSCIVSTDVLEHDITPLHLLKTMVSALHIRGFLVIANNFTPCIKCHLPVTFYLQRTFNLAALTSGLHFIGPCKGSHANIFQKTRIAPFFSTGVIESLCRAIAPAIDSAASLKRAIKRVLS